MVSLSLSPVLHHIQNHNHTVISYFYRPKFPIPTYSSSSSTKHQFNFHHLHTFSLKTKLKGTSCFPKIMATQSSSSSSSSSCQTVEHIVLFKVKSDTDPSKVETMISGLRSLNSLPSVLHLTAGRIFHRTASSQLSFTHLLHSRYSSKEDLSSYSTHPSHLSVVKNSVLPICDDILAVDWLSDLATDGPIAPPPGSAMRLTLLKLKDPAGDQEKAEIFTTLGGVKAGFPQMSYGENFSPARAKGFSIGSIAIFPGKKDLDGFDDKGEMVEIHKAKVRELLDSVIVADYLLDSPLHSSPLSTANL